MLEPLIPFKHAQQYLILDTQIVQQIGYDQNAQTFGSSESVGSLERVRLRFVVIMREVVPRVHDLVDELGHVGGNP